MCKLRFIKNTEYNEFYPYKIGDIINYEPWERNYQGETEQERLLHGLYVFCDGHGEFRSYKEGVDVVKIDNVCDSFIKTIKEGKE